MTRPCPSKSQEKWSRPAKSLASRSDTSKSPEAITVTWSFRRSKTSSTGSTRTNAGLKRRRLTGGDWKIERQRDRETERQRDRETERQRDRETERQRDRETERQRDGGTWGRKARMTIAQSLRLSFSPSLRLPLRPSYFQ